MKTLTNNTLIFDQDCPMCAAYTSTFIKTGMLDQNGRKSFSCLNEKDLNLINMDRASNEIALIDYQNNQVLYGIDSLLRVIGNSFPFIEKIGKKHLVYYALKKLYAFISYNRKVIMPNTKTIQPSVCVPSFNLKYRLIYILFCIGLTILILFNFSHLMHALPKSTMFRESLLAIGQIVFQSAFLLKYDKKTIINYIGHLMTVSLIGSILLSIILMFNTFYTLNEITLIICFFLVASFMFFEHARRVKVLQLPLSLSITWVIYRIIALIIILNF